MQEANYREAFKDFLENVYPLAFPEGKRRGKEYNRVRQAIHAYYGRGKQPKQLTAVWVARILGDYAHLAPGRYRIEMEVRIYIQK